MSEDGRIDPSIFTNNLSQQLTNEERAALLGEGWSDRQSLPPRSVKHGRKKFQLLKLKETDTSYDTRSPIQEQALPESVQPALQSRSKRFVIKAVQWGIGLPLLVAFIFWAKFAYVYDIPDFMLKSSVVKGATGYICYKPWIFGPPFFSLNQRLITADQRDFNSLQTALSDYKEIIDDKKVFVVYRVYKRESR